MSHNPGSSKTDPYDFNEQHFPREDKKGSGTMLARKTANKRTKAQKEVSSPPSSKVPKIDNISGNNSKSSADNIKSGEKTPPSRKNSTEKNTTPEKPGNENITTKNPTSDKTTPGKNSSTGEKLTDSAKNSSKSPMSGVKKSPSSETGDRSPQEKNSPDKNAAAKSPLVQVTPEKVAPTLQAVPSKAPSTPPASAGGAGKTLPTKPQPQSSILSSVLTGSTVPSTITKETLVQMCDIEVQTDAASLGPCEPGTSVILEGVVWHESESGMLVINVTWKGKKYIGTLLDISRHEWAPPNFCPREPSREKDSGSPPVKLRGRKGKAKRPPLATNPWPSPRNFCPREPSREKDSGSPPVKLRGRKGKAKRPPLASNPRPSPRKWGQTPPSNGDNGHSSENTNGSNTDEKSSKPDTLVVCTEHKCSKKFRGPNCHDALEYHKIHAHASSVAVATKCSQTDVTEIKATTNLETEEKSEKPQVAKTKELTDSSTKILEGTNTKEPKNNDPHSSSNTEQNKPLDKSNVLQAGRNVRESGGNVGCLDSTSNTLSAMPGGKNEGPNSVQFPAMAATATAVATVFSSSGSSVVALNKKTSTPPVAVLKPLVPAKDNSKPTIPSSNPANQHKPHQQAPAPPTMHLSPGGTGSGTNIPPYMSVSSFQRNSASVSSSSGQSAGKPVHAFHPSFNTAGSGRGGLQGSRNSAVAPVSHAVAPVPATVLPFSEPGPGGMDRRSSHTYSDISDASDQEMDAISIDNTPPQFNQQGLPRDGPPPPPNTIEDRLFCNEELGLHSPPAHPAASGDSGRPSAYLGRPENRTISSVAVTKQTTSDENRNSKLSSTSTSLTSTASIHHHHHGNSMYAKNTSRSAHSPPLLTSSLHQPPAITPAPSASSQHPHHQIVSQAQQQVQQLAQHHQMGNNQAQHQQAQPYHPHGIRPQHHPSSQPNTPPPPNLPQPQILPPHLNPGPPPGHPHLNPGPPPGHPHLNPGPPPGHPHLPPHHQPHHQPLMYPYMPFLPTSQNPYQPQTPVYAAPYLMTYAGLSPFMGGAPGGPPPQHHPAAGIYPPPPARPPSPPNRGGTPNK